jgi:imidazolonepropionase-like amidohydrolase
MTACGAQTESASERPRADLIIAGGLVVHPESDALPTVEDIAIADGLILAIGAGLAARYDAAATYDASGRTVVPGLADMHSHFGNGILAGDADDTGPVLARHLYFGNTTILNLGSAQAWPDRIDALRAAMASGELAGPRLLAVGSLMTLPGSHPTTTIYSPAIQKEIADLLAHIRTEGPIDLAPLRATTLVWSPENITAEVNRVGGWGADAIKITVESGPSDFGDDHPQMPPELIAAAAEAAKAYDIPVLCHISSLDEVEDCLANGASGIVHALTPETDETIPDGLEQRMADAHFTIIPTAAMFDGWRRYGDDPSLLDQPALQGVLSDSEKAWLSSPPMQENFGASPEWDAAINLMAAHLKKFHDLGGAIVAGTDTGNPYRFAGLALHEELAFYVENVGLSPREALATATGNAARLVGDENEWGAIRVGLAADLLILAANPLDDIRNTLAIAAVVKGGEVVDRGALELH